MKRIFFTLMSLLLVTGLFAQEIIKAGNVTVQEDNDKTVVKIGDGSLIVEESQDTTRIRLGKKGVTIIEDENGTRVDWSDLEDEEEIEDTADSEDSEDEMEEDEGSKTGKFKPNWSGLEVGINNYLNSDFNMELAPENSFMDLNTGRSWNFNLNFLEYGLGLGTDKVGIVTGLGLEWNNYHFDDGNVIYENAEGIIDRYDVPDLNSSIQRAKLQTTYLTAPLLMEFQIPAGKKRIHISGGVIGGVKIGSKTKVIYTVSGDKQKDKVKDDFNLSPLRYGFTARIGYRNLNLFANYYPTPLFEKGKGPELYPFSVGLRLLSL
ncbi:MAG: outer membrane beta-barrel protein [Bacteroidales bacterium]|nr:outer membrane beta-barrel protein [Bacteroidales bacterium]